MAKLTKKSYKRRRVVMGLALFMSIALISTGFAAWVISSQSKDNGSGNVTVGTISDKSIEITINNKNDLGTFKFEPDKNDTTGRVRYEGNGSENYESLTVTISGSVTNPNYLGSLTIKLVELNPETNEEIALDSSNLKAASDKNYIGLPDCFYEEVELKGTDAYTSSDESKGTFEYDITFTWGSEFGLVNPSIYYDEEGSDVPDSNMLQTLVDLRNTIYGTSDVVGGEQDTNTNSPKYKVIVTATSN